jgi:hypothetical protein
MTDAIIVTLTFPTHESFFLINQSVFYDSHDNKLYGRIVKHLQKASHKLYTRI